ncbi:hypothetical protein B0J11DRAFT_449544 [Dendryphion nanum]|uniref:Uncharacterized protein n=1 Tax=Dendryphion nanum TaxID=256645 RepID=A0A9P9I5N0_9PLEO|nr:hypothetical protein B0J11DRAFT_449544 [Dendryphion nanum]
MAESQVPGNTTLASDLYGDGVRIGIYLQVLGMLLCCIRHKQSGIKLASSSTILALLAAWSVRISKEDLSPVEAWIVLAIIGLIWVPTIAALVAPTNMVGEGVATTALAVALIWHTFAMIAFWSTLFKSLPQLGTQNMMFFLGRVNIKGRVSEFMVAVGGGQIFILAPSLIIFLIMIRRGTKAWLRGEKELDIESLHQEKRWMKKSQQRVVAYLGVLGLLGWTVGIIAVELMIRWNGLVPVKDLSQPGQLVPFVTGIIICTDAFVGLLQPPWNVRGSRGE